MCLKVFIIQDFACKLFNEWCRPEWMRSSELGATVKIRALGERFVVGMLPSTSFLLASLSPFLGVGISHIAGGVWY